MPLADVCSTQTVGTILCVCTHVVSCLRYTQNELTPNIGIL